jgi:OOP family OmpA-OmpF porin
MKKQLICFSALFISLLGQSQVRVGITGGYHHNFASSDYLVPAEPVVNAIRTSLRSGHFGVTAEVPIAQKNWFFQSGVIHFKRGQEQTINFDTTQARYHFITGRSTQNYIDLPFSVAFKQPVGENFRFIIGGGPQLSLFIKGLEVATTTRRMIVKDRNNNDSAYITIREERQDKLLVGKATDRYRLSFFSVKGFSGFEYKNLYVIASYTKGLTTYYERPEEKLKHDNWSASVGLYIFRAKTEDITKKVLDTDRDGIEDANDLCPTEAGPPVTNGCPDKDGDGITDKSDACPEVSGLTKYKGCPIPDSDGDGVNDEQDKCPQQPGTDANNGCPAAIIEAPVVKKPQDVEVITQKTVDQINLNAKRIAFKFRQAELTEESYKILDEIVSLLKNSSVKIKVEGHSSLEGNPKTNLKLSQERADNVKKYLVQQGITIERITSIGYGSTQPLVKGTSEKANVQNRRVEIEIDNK